MFSGVTFGTCLHINCGIEHMEGQIAKDKNHCDCTQMLRFSQQDFELSTVYETIETMWHETKDQKN